MIENNRFAVEQISADNPVGEAGVPCRTAKRSGLLRYGAGALVLAAALALAGCYGPPLGTREESTLLGGASGLGAGALVGSALGAPGAGAAIGGVAGAGAGYLIGNQLQSEQYRRDWGGGRWREGGWHRGGWGRDDD